MDTGAEGRVGRAERAALRCDRGNPAVWPRELSWAVSADSEGRDCGDEREGPQERDVCTHVLCSFCCTTL